MWKKPEGNQSSGTVSEANLHRPALEQLKDRAIVGSSIQIRGDLLGEEDLLIQGQVEGKIDLKQNNVTIGERGRVKANVWGKIISVEGQIEGDLYASEKIVIRKSGNVKGNLFAPRVNLEDGARFKGTIDMDSAAGAAAPAQPAVASSPAPKPSASVMSRSPERAESGSSASSK